MKKSIILVIFLSLLTSSCTTSSIGEFTKSFFGEKLVNLTPEEQFERKMRSYKLEATFKTNKGDLNVILYPDAAPLNVAHFVYLVQHKFYDNMVFHRVIPSAIIQTGDNVGDGTGDSGVKIKDEFVDWLDFKSSGMLAMANVPNVKDTNGSQIFFTLSPISQFDNQYTIIGELSTKEDLSKARLIRLNDVINEVEIRGINVDEFLDNFKEYFDEWSNYMNK